MLSLLTIVTLIGYASGAGAGWTYGYESNGDDWPLIHPPAGEINYCATNTAN